MKKSEKRTVPQATYVRTCEEYTRIHYSPHRAPGHDFSAFFSIAKTKSDEVSHVHRHLLDLSGVELLDITEVPHVALETKESKEENAKGGKKGRKGRLVKRVGYMGAMRLPATLHRNKISDTGFPGLPQVLALDYLKVSRH